MAKKICCCKDETQPPVALEKHYIAIPCWEYNSNIYSDITLGIKNLYRYPTQSPVNPSVVAGFTNPVKITSMSTVNGTYVCSPDYDRMSRVMLRGGGGGSNTGGSGGNGAYIDANIVPSKINPQANQIGYFIGAGGTGPILPYDFSVSTTTILSGGPAQPMSGRGGAAASVGPNSTSPYLFFAAGGGGAGSTTGSNGGHGGVIEGHDGLGDRPGIGGSQLYGGTFGDTQAFRGSFPSPYIGGRGSYSWLPTVDPTLSNTSGGGGGGGWKGGGGGGQKSGGGGGSSSLEPYSPTQTTYPDKIEVVVGADGTNIGPGNRCSPYFTFNYDPGLGANRSGRYIAGNTFFTPYRGTNSQVASYFKKRWCVGSESQSTEYPWGNVTGVLSDTEPLHICLTQAQYDVIIANMPGEAAPIANTSQTPLKGVRLSFELNQQKYILAQINDLNCKDTQNHYSCTLSCESNFLEDGTPSNVKFYIPSVNFGTIKDSVNWFKANWPTYDFRNVTSCCDKIVAEPICIGGYGNYCTGTVDVNTGVASGCLCDRPPSPPITSGNKPSGVNGAYIHRAENGWYFLCLPAFGWANYGDSEIVQRYTNDRDDVYSPVLNFTDVLSPNITANAPSINLTTLQSIYCQDSGGGPNTCTNQGTNWSEEDCKPILLARYPYPDFYGINSPVYVSSGGGFCMRGCQGYATCAKPEGKAQGSAGAGEEMIAIDETGNMSDYCKYFDPDAENCGNIACTSSLCDPVPECCTDGCGCLCPDPNCVPNDNSQGGGGQQFKSSNKKDILISYTEQFTSVSSINKKTKTIEELNIEKEFSENAGNLATIKRIVQDNGQIKYVIPETTSYYYNEETETIQNRSLSLSLNPCAGGNGPGQGAFCANGDETLQVKVVNIKRGCAPPCAFAGCTIPPYTCNHLCSCVCRINVGANGGERGCGVKELESFEATLCYNQQKVDKIESTEIFEIEFPLCLFPNVGLTNEQLLIEIKKYIQITNNVNKTINYSFIYPSMQISGISLKMCPLTAGNFETSSFDMFIGSASPESIVGKINSCLSGVSARLITPELDEKKYYWFGKRLFTYYYTDENGIVKPGYSQKRGDTLEFSRAYRTTIGSKAVVVFKAVSNEARIFEGTMEGKPICFLGEYCGSDFKQCFRDNTPTSIREWASGTGRPTMEKLKVRTTTLGYCGSQGSSTTPFEIFCYGDNVYGEEPQDPENYCSDGRVGCQFCYMNGFTCFAGDNANCNPNEQNCCVTDCPCNDEWTQIGCPGSALGTCACTCNWNDPCSCGGINYGQGNCDANDYQWLIQVKADCSSGAGAMNVQ
jgi:hypothetical protein